MVITTPFSKVEYYTVAASIYQTLEWYITDKYTRGLG